MAQCVVCSTEIRDDARFCPSCGAEQPRAEVAGTDADPLMGKVVAKKFKIEKLLGVGGMGKVYKARQLSLDKAVVVKVLHDHFRDDPQLVQRFQREAKAASRLNHPNSIQIIDFGQDDTGVVFMAMEYLQGQDLFSLIKKDGPLAPDRIARVMIQVCSALAEAHEQNVIHRDLKPENIMVEDRRGQRDFVKVLDFGIAKIQDPGDGQQALTQAGMVCGTPEYMSPEQARGLTLDPRSDIYALGVVMYQLAVGDLPFHADTPIGIVTKHILEKPVPPRERAPQLNLPVELEQIILKALEKEADKRFKSAIELSDALEHFLQSRGGTFSSPPQTGSGVSARPASEVSGPAAPEQAPVASTKTSPTPTGPARAPVIGGAIEPAPKPASPARAALLSFAVVVVVGIGGGLAWKATRTVAPQTPDAGTTPIVARDAGPPPVVDAGIKAEPDAGPKKIDVVDAGGKGVVDAGPKKEPGGHTPRPPAGGRKRAVELFKEAQDLVAAGDCSAAMPKLIDAGKADKSYAEPLKLVAYCAKVTKNPRGACAAAKEYADRKGLEGSPRDLWLKQYPCE